MDCNRTCCSIWSILSCLCSSSVAPIGSTESLGSADSMNLPNTLYTKLATVFGITISCCIFKKFFRHKMPDIYNNILNYWFSNLLWHWFSTNVKKKVQDQPLCDFTPYIVQHAIYISLSIMIDWLADWLIDPSFILTIPQTATMIVSREPLATCSIKRYLFDTLFFVKCVWYSLLFSSLLRSNWRNIVIIFRIFAWKKSAFNFISMMYTR